MGKEEALELAAQAWCQPSTNGKIVDPELANAFADILVRETKRAADEVRLEEVI